ncbi:reverse transcriptase domain-containing protein, partial [Tanacetum coccineum]
MDIFAWKPSDMTGVPRLIAEHRLNIREGYSPVRQKKRGQAPERAKAIQAEVQKLVGAGIMREVYYHEWLSNPVMVKKYDGSWQMCVDFMDLNKALEGMFLGYMISPEGIKSCPDKTEAVLQLLSPRTIKEVQSLNGKLAKAEQAFNQLKQHLSDLPLLVAPKPKEELIVYLSATHEAISAVLMTERGTVQMPIYFVSRALQGPELNYTPMEKLVLSLVFAAKRLRRTIYKNGAFMLGNTISAYGLGRKVKRTDPRGFPYGSDAGLILTSPEGTEFTYMPIFQFTASNNEVEATTVVEEDGPTWMTPIIEYLKEGTLPDDKRDASKLRIKARQYEFLEGVLYRRSFLKPWLRSCTAEIGMPTYRIAAVDAVHNDKELRLNLDLLEERRECAAIREAKTKLKMAKYYNARVRGVTFKLRDFVYRSNDASHAVGEGKLSPKWEGSYE